MIRLSKIDQSNTKISKSEKSRMGGESIRILSLSMMPDDIICPARNLAECANDCLRSSGRGIMQNVIDGRQARTDFWHNDRDAFLASKRRTRYAVKCSVRHPLGKTSRFCG